MGAQSILAYTTPQGLLPRVEYLRLGRPKKPPAPAGKHLAYEPKFPKNKPQGLGQKKQSRASMRARYRVRNAHEFDSPESRGFTAPRPITKCAQCGDRLFLPEWSEHMDDRCVRHLWKCESCGYSFETTFVYARLETAAA